MQGIIYKSSKREFEVKLENGELVQCVALGNLLKGENTIVVGDNVVVESEDQGFIIKEVLERKSEIFRFLVRQNKKKVTASNVDLLVIVTSLSKPNYKQGLIDRFLVRSSQWEVPAVVVFNKADQHDEEEVDLSFEVERFRSLDVKSFVVSAKATSERFFQFEDYQSLKETLKGKNAIFLGQSGVGKSSLISQLSGIDLKTKEVGKVGKGSHTTTWSEMIDLDSFSLIDSPGIRSFALDDIDPDLLQDYFPDILHYSSECKFHDCSHDENAKGCFFYGKIDSLSQEKREILVSRLESFKRIRQEIQP